MLKVNGDETGGMMAMPPEVQGMPPMRSIYITVNDVDATTRKVTDLGGTILRPPMDIANVGRFCVLQDPQGRRHLRHHLRGATRSVILTHRGDGDCASDLAETFCRMEVRAEAVMMQTKTNAAAEVA